MADKTRVGIAAVSMELVSVDQRRADIVAAIESAAAQGCQLVCLPEFVHIQRTAEAVADVEAGCGDDIYSRTAEPLPDGPSCRAIAEACRRCGIWVMAGLCERWADGHVTNAVVVMSDQGEIVARHHKTHCAPGEDEEGGVSGGDVLEPLETPFGKVGVMTCFEAYFPEIARVYEAKGADWLFYPHADNSAHCLTVAQSRAFDSHMPLVMCGYVDPTGEGSAVGVAGVDAKGRVLAHKKDGAGVLVVDVDLKQRVQSSERWDRPEAVVDQRDFRWARRRPELFRLLGE